jgi:hypothetical protein
MPTLATSSVFAPVKYPTPLMLWSKVPYARPVMWLQLATCEFEREPFKSRQDSPTKRGIKMICSECVWCVEWKLKYRAHIRKPIGIPESRSPTRTTSRASGVQTSHVGKVICEPEIHGRCYCAPYFWIVDILLSTCKATMPCTCHSCYDLASTISNACERN